MSTNSPSDDDELVLYVWPGTWDLPTFNPECLASILYAQMVLPGGFVVEESTNPDMSPNGHLPYLTHGLTTLSTFASIAKHLSSLRRRRGPNMQPALEPVQLAQETAWLAFAQAHLGDLLACSFYTLKDNFWDGFRPVIASMLPVPQRYYVPDRLRDLHKTRLESVGLWNIAAEEKEAESNPNAHASLSETAQSAFGKEKVLEKARSHLDILSNLLHDKTYFFGNEPGTLDAMVAAHILLLVIPPLPNDLLRVFVTTNYPSLCTHALRLLSLTQDNLSPTSSQSLLISTPYASEFDLQNATVAHQITPSFVPLSVRSSQQTAHTAFTSVFSALWGNSFWSKKVVAEKSEEEKYDDRLRWGWYALAVTSVFAWAAMSGLRIMVTEVRKEEVHSRSARSQREEENDEEDEDEDEEDGVEIEVDEDEDDGSE